MSSVVLLREVVGFLHARARINKLLARAAFGRPPKCCVIYGGLRPPATHARQNSPCSWAAFGIVCQNNIYIYIYNIYFVYIRKCKQNGSQNQSKINEIKTSRNHQNTIEMVPKSMENRGCVEDARGQCSALGLWSVGYKRLFASCLGTCDILRKYAICLINNLLFNEHFQRISCCIRFQSKIQTNMKNEARTPPKCENWEQGWAKVRPRAPKGSQRRAKWSQKGAKSEPKRIKMWVKGIQKWAKFNIKST